jgi:hypothetical protein
LRLPSDKKIIRYFYSTFVANFHGNEDISCSVQMSIIFLVYNFLRMVLM